MCLVLSLYVTINNERILTMKQTWSHFVLALILFSVLSCGSTDNPVDSSNKIDTITVPETEAEIELGEGLVIGTHAPDFQLSDGDGNIHTLAENLVNGKHVVIVFYRTGG